MNVEEIRKEVRRMCEDEGLDFFFVCSSPNASEWAVTDCEHLRKIVSYHKELETLPPVTSTQRWIPVSERLPENETCVLTTIKIPNRIARVRSGWYDSGFIHNDNGDVWKATDMEVLAWMPLPEPYKEGEEE